MTIIEQMDQITANEKKHLYYAPMISIIFLFKNMIERQSSFNLNVDTIFKNLTKDLEKLTKLENKHFNNKVIRDIKQLRKAIQRDSLYLSTKVLYAHNTINALCAMLDKHDVNKFDTYNLTISMKSLKKKNIISEDDGEMIRVLNAFRNVIAHTTGTDTFINMNSRKLSVIKVVLNETASIISKLILNHYDILLEWQNTLRPHLPKNMLKMI